MLLVRKLSAFVGTARRRVRWRGRTELDDAVAEYREQAVTVRAISCSAYSSLHDVH
jgi:hypothetical protein